MGKEKKTRTVKLETHEPDTCPMIVCEVKKSIPRMRIVKTNERIKVTSMKSSSTPDRGTTTCGTSDSIMKLCVNLMPVLASAKEPVEEEEKEIGVNSCPTEKKPEKRKKKDPSAMKLVEQTLNISDSYTGLTLKKANETKQQLTPGLVLPPLTQPKPAPERCDHQETKMCFTSLPPIGLFEQTTTICPNFTTKGCSDDGDSRPWIDNPPFSRSRSTEFCLPKISLSSLDALLQTVTQKLARKSRGSDDGPWRRVQSDQLLTAVKERRLKEKMKEEEINLCTEEGNWDNIAAATKPSMSGHSVKSQTNLPLFSVPKSTAILTMKKKTF